MVHEISDVSFDDFVQNGTFVVVDFYSTWCPPCKLLSRTMDEIAEEYGGQLLVGKINVDTNPETAQKYGVMSMPTVLVFQHGHAVSNFVGNRPKQNMLALLGLAVV